MSKVPTIEGNKVISSTNVIFPLSQFLYNPIADFISKVFQFNVLFAIGVPDDEIHINEKDLQKFLFVNEFDRLQVYPQNKLNKSKILNVFIDNTITEGYVLISATTFQEFKMKNIDKVEIKLLNMQFLTYSASIFDHKFETQKLIMLYLIADLMRNTREINHLIIFDHLRKSLICKEKCLTRELLTKKYFDLVLKKLKEYKFVTVRDGTLKLLNVHPDLRNNIRDELSQVLSCLKGW